MYTSINKRNLKIGATDTTQKIQKSTDRHFIMCFLSADMYECPGTVGFIICSNYNNHQMIESVIKIM